MTEQAQTGTEKAPGRHRADTCWDLASIEQAQAVTKGPAGGGRDSVRSGWRASLGVRAKEGNSQGHMQWGAGGMRA